MAEVNTAQPGEQRPEPVEQVTRSGRFSRCAAWFRNIEDAVPAHCRKKLRVGAGDIVSRSPLKQSLSHHWPAGGSLHVSDDMVLVNGRPYENKLDLTLKPGNYQIGGKIHVSCWKVLPAGWQVKQSSLQARLEGTLQLSIKQVWQEACHE